MSAEHAVLIGYGMAALVQLNPPQPREVAVLDIDQAVADATPKDALDTGGHGRAGLAGAGHVDVAKGAEAVAAPAGDERVAFHSQVAQDGLQWVGGSEGGAENELRLLPELSFGLCHG